MVMVKDGAVPWLDADVVEVARYAKSLRWYD
jgi:hypothetical protein